MCLLLAAATVSVEAQKPAVPLAPLKIEPPRKPWEFDPLGRTRSTVKPPKQPPAKEFESTVKSPKQPPAKELESTVKPPKQQLAKELDPRLQLVQTIDSGFTHFSVVEGAVKGFAHDFEVGARNHASYESKIPLELLKPWKEVTRDKRIFIIGAGKDSTEISKAAESLRAQGNAVFFYDFCRPLCSSEAVGAMFGTSGRTMLYNTPSAELSKYVKVEAATARFLKGLDSKQPVLISTEELLAGRFSMYVANKPTPTPSAVK